MKIIHGFLDYWIINKPMDYWIINKPLDYWIIGLWTGSINHPPWAPPFQVFYIAPLARLADRGALFDPNQTAAGARSPAFRVETESGWISVDMVLDRENET